MLAKRGNPLHKTVSWACAFAKALSIKPPRREEPLVSRPTKCCSLGNKVAGLEVNQPVVEKEPHCLDLHRSQSSLCRPPRRCGIRVSVNHASSSGALPVMTAQHGVNCACIGENAARAALSLILRERHHILDRRFSHVLVRGQAEKPASQQCTRSGEDQTKLHCAGCCTDVPSHRRPAGRDGQNHLHCTPVTRSKNRRQDTSREEHKQEPHCP